MLDAIIRELSGVLLSVTVNELEGDYGRLESLNAHIKRIYDLCVSNDHLEEVRPSLSGERRMATNTVDISTNEPKSYNPEELFREYYERHLSWRMSSISPGSDISTYLRKLSSVILDAFTYAKQLVEDCKKNVDVIDLARTVTDIASRCARTYSDIYRSLVLGRERQMQAISASAECIVAFKEGMHGLGLHIGHILDEELRTDVRTAVLSQGKRITLRVRGYDIRLDERSEKIRSVGSVLLDHDVEVSKFTMEALDSLDKFVDLMGAFRMFEVPRKPRMYTHY